MSTISKLLTVGILMLAVCGFDASAKKKQSTVVAIEMESTANPGLQFTDLSHGVRLSVTSDIDNTQIIDWSGFTDGKQLKKLQSEFQFEISPEVREFVNEGLSRYMRRMGLGQSNPESDYTLNVRVCDFKYALTGNVSSPARTAIAFEYVLKSPDNVTVLSQTARGRYVSAANEPDARAIDKAFTKALEDVDWNAIAGALKVKKRADQEPQKKVTGDGESALEQTVIRWYIISAPMGADVYWRVVSSTPDVKNTNSAFMGNTPYESTESFDIKGLKYGNAGNVQIEVTCEKAGYLPQKKRFNLRQAIDQREISAKFNLVKEETEEE